MSRHDSNPDWRPDARVTRTQAVSKSVQERQRALNAERLGLAWLGKLGKGLMDPHAGLSLLVVLLFALCSTLLAWWTRAQVVAPVGRVMTDTRLVRVETMLLDDPDQTRRLRQQAQDATPRVFQLDAGVLDALLQSIESLPQAVRGEPDIEKLDPNLVKQFALTKDIVTELERVAKAEAALDDGKETVGPWDAAVQRLRKMLSARPFVEAQTYLRGVQEGTSRFVRLTDPREPEARPKLVLRTELVSVTDVDAMKATADMLVRDAGIPLSVREAIAHRIAHASTPTFTFDEASTIRDENAQAESVPPAVIESPRRQVIVERGDTLTAAQAQLLKAEHAAFIANLEPWAKALIMGAIAAACATITLGLTGYGVLFAPRIQRRWTRTLGVAILMFMMLLAACVGSVMRPELAGVLSVLPTALVAMLFCIGYDRRSALAFGLLHGLLVCICLGSSVAMYAIMATGVACVVASLREVRDRKSLVRVSLASGVGLALATVVFGLLERPMSWPAAQDLATDAGLAFGGMLLVGGLTLFVLPVIERVFGVVTGLTLGELRDPKQPLLRELQMRAPGTYTHSLNVASIAEQAAEAVGCDGLLTYVGCLYHDVGKMNKPEYFVENQTAGINKHDRLSPAMSLLVVVGHVKDGVELAREFRLPLRLSHFIEAHHGTTLVEYFYHRARKQALTQGEDDPHMPDEFEYRYPGPKPRTKEVAILMICDAVESAARALGEPTPAKIESLVREIADKRLRDGQFDECDLTLRELSIICESIARSVTSMYHSRVAYPGGRENPTPEVKVVPASEPAVRSVVKS
jgi:putative nucleotidyltransferase with HDIG domain